MQAPTTWILQRKGGDGSIWIDIRGFPTPSKAAAQRFPTEAKAMAYLRAEHPAWQDAYEAVPAPKAVHADPFPPAA